MIEEHVNTKFMKYKSVLIIEEDEVIVNKIRYLLCNKIKKLEIVSSISKIINLKSFDLIIIDIDHHSLSALNSFFSEVKYNTPVVVVTSNINENILEFSSSNMIKNILSKKTQLDDLYMYIYLILKEKSKFDLGKNFYYCLERDVLLDIDRKISLTRLENKLLKFLIINKDRIITYKEIEEDVWKKDKCSIFTIRNVIKKIRTKTYQEIICNISTKGYKINDTFL